MKYAPFLSCSILLLQFFKWNTMYLDFDIRYRPGQPNWEYTIWKIHDFSANKILREINDRNFTLIFNSSISISLKINFFDKELHRAVEIMPKCHNTIFTGKSISFRKINVLQKSWFHGIILRVIAHSVEKSSKTHTVEKSRIYSHRKNISSNQLFQCGLLNRHEGRIC